MLALATLSYRQRLEVRRIEVSAGVVAGSLELAVEDDVETFTFDMETEPTVEQPRADVREVERIHFVYTKGAKFGETAPTHVLCDREDFPRNVGHLCAGEPGCPAAPCLAIGGLQPLYERVGIEAIMVRLRDFLRDAKTGTLMTDGWEPVPLAVGQMLRPGEVIPKFFQDHAVANPTVGRAVGVAVNFDSEDGRQVILFPQVIAPAQVSDAIASRNSETGAAHGIPWVFLWRDPAQIETDPIFEAWRTGAELREGMKRIGVEHDFDAAVGDLLVRDVNFYCKHPEGRKAVAVVLGVWRPAPIMDGFFGYSDDPLARRLELRAFMVSQELGKEIVADDTVVEAMVGHYPPSPELMRWVAGVDELPAIALFGFGALGSAVYNNLVRSGLADALVVDFDTLQPHNLARHTGRITDLYGDKVDHAEQLIGEVQRHGAAQIELKNEDISSLDTATLRECASGRLVIDATADERVRLKMDDLRTSSDSVIIRAEMFHEGRLGVTFISPAEGPTPSDMMISLVSNAPNEPAVAAWLKHEVQHPLGIDPLLYGFGCTSQTVHLPNHVIELQASVATNVILDDHTAAGIALNPLDEHYRPLGWKWIPVAPFTVFVPPKEDDWSIRLSTGVIDHLKAERLRALPSETGGYLYGMLESSRQTITIVYATGLPPDSVGSPTSLDLGPAGTTPEERRLGQKTHNRIYLCGTWHSHPSGSAGMSGKDYKAMMKHHARDAEMLRPTLIVIVADDEIKAHLKVPYA